MAIRILPPDVAEKIAAGEVIERPASVVKELIENSLDAGASRVRVSITGGGTGEISVQDNGCGIPRDEVVLAFARHATSKLTSFQDLDRLNTLGFRGEALASISAVARVILTTRHEQEETGSQTVVTFAEVDKTRPEASAVGTMVVVTDLFANLPARRKFLRKPATETQQIIATVSRYAMAHFNTAFTLIVDGRQVLQTFGSGLLDAVRRVHGPEIADSLVAVEAKVGRAQVNGFTSPPDCSRSSARYLDTFVNGRWIQDRLLTRAVLQSYHSLIPAGRYPIATLLLHIPSDEIDVNVHPAKAEVRFSNPDTIFELVFKAVRGAVSDSSLVPTFSISSIPRPRDEREQGSSLQVGTSPSSPGAIWRPQTRLQTQLPELVQQPATLPPLRAVGQVQQTYIVAEGPDGLYLVDQHAAHERILFERFLKQRDEGQPVSQTLLSPLSIDLASSRAQLLPQLAEHLEALGFQAEPFGPNVAILRAIPAVLAERPTNLEAAFLDAFDALAENNGERWLEHTLVRVVCHAAVRAGETLDIPRMRDMLRELERTSSPRTCPHGRPTMLYLSSTQVEREFRRR